MTVDQQTAGDHRTAPAAPSAPAQLWVRYQAPTAEESRHGFAIVSIYVEQFWTAILGPTAIAILRNLARHKIRVGEHYEPINVQLARVALGIGHQGHGGKNGTFYKSINRLARYEALTIDQTQDGFPTHLTLRTHLQIVGYQFTKRWPEELREQHRTFLDQLNNR